MVLFFLLNFISVFMFMSSTYIYSSKRKHLMIILLKLQFMVLGLFIMITNYMSYMQEEMYFLIMFLVFSVCEGSLQLAVLVSMIRSHGNDYVSSLSMILCMVCYFIFEV